MSYSENTARSWTVSNTLRAIALAALTAPALLTAGVAGAAATDPDRSYKVIEAGAVSAEIHTFLEAPPSEVPLFAVDPDEVTIPIEVLQDVFDVHGDVNPALAPRGAKHCSKGDRHVLFAPDGPGEYTDTTRNHKRTQVTRVDHDILWDTSAALLKELDASDTTALIQVVPERILEEPCKADACDPFCMGSVGRQTVEYGLTIEGLETFGPGATVYIRFAGDDQVVGFSHAIRGLAPIRRERTLSPARAIRNWLERIDLGNQWTLEGDDEQRPERLEVYSIQLGYVVPEFGDHQGVVAPVYEIRARAFNMEDSTNPTVTAVTWYEPAVASAALSILPNGDAAE